MPKAQLLNCNSRTHIMGILNVTPDSFSDGGCYQDPSAAVDRALEMAAEGADIIDIGGESSRPGARPVPAAEELKRVLPVIRAIRDQSDVALSLDTRKSQVAREGIAAGINWINDISAGESDPDMVPLVAEHQVPYVIMHMRGTPETMAEKCHYLDVAEEVGLYLKSRCAFLQDSGIHDLIVDPGIGFAKTPEQNLALLRDLTYLKGLSRPILVGASRKSFIYKMLEDNNDNLLEGSLAVAAVAVLQGCQILRVHDVASTRRLCRVLDTFKVYTNLSS